VRIGSPEADNDDKRLEDRTQQPQNTIRNLRDFRRLRLPGNREIASGSELAQRFNLSGSVSYHFVSPSGLFGHEDTKTPSFVYFYFLRVPALVAHNFYFHHVVENIRQQVLLSANRPELPKQKPNKNTAIVSFS